MNRPPVALQYSYAHSELGNLHMKTFWVALISAATLAAFFAQATPFAFVLLSAFFAIALNLPSGDAGGDDHPAQQTRSAGRLDSALPQSAITLKDVDFRHAWNDFIETSHLARKGHCYETITRQIRSGQLQPADPATVQVANAIHIWVSRVFEKICDDYPGMRSERGTIPRLYLVAWRQLLLGRVVDFQSSPELRAICTRVENFVSDVIRLHELDSANH